MPGSAKPGTRLADKSVRRATIRTLHQAIAFDAIDRLDGPDAEAWQRLFLKHGRCFAHGVEAPDADFGDYRNHVLFPADTGTSGAVGKAVAWYRNLVNALGRQEWRNAAYCAGVLAHYVIDPLHPFHTGQSTAENDVHHAADTAAWLNYRALAQRAAGSDRPDVAPLGTGGDFLAVALTAGAADANRDFERLVAHTDLARARRRPASALDDQGSDITADFIARATALTAAIIRRAIAQSHMAAPASPLAMTTIAAWAAAPVAAVARWVRSWRMARTVRGMAREQARTGRVETWLPAEERAKRATSASIAPVRKPRAPQSGKVVRLAPTPTSSATDLVGSIDGEIIDLQRRRMTIEQPRPAPRYVPVDRQRPLADAAVASAHTGLSAFVTPPAPAIAASAPARSPMTAAVGHAAAATLTPGLAGGLSNFRDRRAATPPEAPAARVAPRAMPH